MPLLEKLLVNNDLFYNSCIYREQTTQTKRDNYSNVPKPQTYLAGLRGGGMSVPTDMTKMDLTVDVDQT